MNIRVFASMVPGWLSGPLALFEREFTYPLGPTTRFRISHGEDYLRFFRSMSERDEDSVCVVAEKEGRVLGTLCGAVQTLDLPGGGEVRALYVGDLKIAIAARRTRVLMLLARAMMDWATPRALGAYSVVMDGTDVTPASYTGRVGLPTLTRVVDISVLRLETGRILEMPPVEEARWQKNVGALLSGSVAHLRGRPALRSRGAVVRVGGDTALGRLEDTLAAKQLLHLDGGEMASAHLSCFCYRSPGEGAALLAMVRRAVTLPALFTAVPAEESGELLEALRSIDPSSAATTTVAGAGVFATGLPAGVPWVVNTAEI